MKTYMSYEHGRTGSADAQWQGGPASLPGNLQCAVLRPASVPAGQGTLL